MRIKIAIIGIGNCASSLVQGIHYCKAKASYETVGVLHEYIGNYKPEDIEVVYAVDIDQRKVGKDLHTAIFSPPNCTTKFVSELGSSKVVVQMGKVLDGFPQHMKQYDSGNSFVLSDEQEVNQAEIIEKLQDSGAEILINYLPVGSEQATKFYAECALHAGLAFINNIPVFIASDPTGVWVKKFEQAKLPIIGDDIKSQLGATIVHRALTDLFAKRGVELLKTYQLNTGGNTDFLNMMDHSRLLSKKESKTESVQSVTKTRLVDENIHIGPSDYVSWQKDNKLSFIRLEGKLFGGIPMNLELRLSVEDSPNSAGVVIDSIRCAKLAIDRKEYGILEAPSAYYYKHPPKQFTDNIAYQKLKDFLTLNK